MPALPYDLTDAQVLVLGAGVSGIASTRLLKKISARPCLVEDNPDAAAAADNLDVPIFTMEDAVEQLASTTLVVTSPGIPPHHPFFAEAEKTGVPVWGDVELCWHVDRSGLCGPSRVWIAITGTNGKTTTTGMTTAICQEAGMNAQACGNIGYPIADALLDPSHPDVLVCELSSFQLHWAPSIRPLAGAVLNIDEDHLDWHGSMDNYIDAKSRVLHGLYAVVGLDDPRACAVRESATAPHVMGFRLGQPLRQEVGVYDDGLFDNAFGPNEEARFLIECADITPPGPAGILDAGAAASLAMAAGATPQNVNDGLKNFRVAAHRNDTIATWSGIRFVDDSKATNPHAARSSLTSYDSLVWIAGGQLKGANIIPLVEEVSSRLTGAIVLGQDGQEIVDAIQTVAPEVPVVHIPSSCGAEEAMKTAVEESRRLAQEGDSVVLAPAAASYDMFRGYAHRGDLFARYVNDMISKDGEETRT